MVNILRPNKIWKRASCMCREESNLRIYMPSRGLTVINAQRICDRMTCNHRIFNTERKLYGQRSNCAVLYYNNTEQFIFQHNNWRARGVWKIPKTIKRPSIYDVYNLKSRKIRAQIHVITIRLNLQEKY